METTIAQAIVALAADRRTSAALLAERAAEILIRRAMSGPPAPAEAFRQEMLRTGWALIRTHPANAPVVNLVNALLWQLERVESPTALRQAVVDATAEFRRQMRSHEGRVAEAILPLLPESARLITLASSTTVRSALRHAQRAGRRISVFCAETLPGYEGRDMAQELSNSGIPAAVVSDEGALALLPSANAALVGADHLTSNGLVSKLGTYTLARAAADCGVPFYTLCGSEKFMPPNYVPPADENHNPPPNIDSTPLSLISGIVTEQGVLTSAAVEAWLAAIKLHPALELAPDY